MSSTSVTKDAGTRALDSTRLQRIARVTGLLFLLSLLVPLLNWVLVLSGFIVAGDGKATAERMLANELLFRFGVVNYVLMAVVAVALGLALYELLKAIHNPLARFALALKVLEAGMSAVMGVLLLVALLLLKGQASPASSEVLPIASLVGLFLEIHIPATAIGGMIHGLNLVVFLSLLYISGYVPRVLAGFGVFAFVLIVVYDALLILAPAFSQNPAVQGIGWGPSILFEVAAGSWLLAKGVRTPAAVG